MSYKNRKVLFIHNGPLFCDPEGQFYGIHITNKVKDRYLQLGEAVTFLMRKRVINYNDAKKYSKIDNENFSFVEFPDLMSFSNRLLSYKKADKIIKDCIIEHDVIICRLPSAAGNIGVKYAKRFKKPLLVEFVACGWDSLWNHNWKGKIMAPYFYLKQKKRMKNLSHVIYVTNKFLQDRYPTKGKYKGISNVEINDVNQKNLNSRLEKIQKYKQCDNRELTIGTVAALDVPYKGQADVIRALGRMNKNNKNIFKYKMVGQGSGKKLLEIAKKEGVSDQIEIIGTLPHKKVFEFLKDIDVYIQPSKQEGLPRSVIEAMSIGCPVIGAKTGGIPELIDDSRIFSKGNIKQIKNLITLMIDPEKQIKDAKRNFSKALNFKKDILENERNKFYQQFLMDNGLK